MLLQVGTRDDYEEGDRPCDALVAMWPAAAREQVTVRYVEGATHKFDWQKPAEQYPDEFAQAGGLMGYGVDIPGQFRHAAVFVDKILKGAKPGDLHVERATRFDLVINLKTAKALGLTIPQSLLSRADEVIQ